MLSRATWQRKFKFVTLLYTG